jgi:hypothetical protein
MNEMISDLTQTTIELNLSIERRWKDLLDTVLEKDVQIQELEELKEVAEHKLTDMK